jgi:hypothetical protein
MEMDPEESVKEAGATARVPVVTVPVMTSGAETFWLKETGLDELIVVPLTLSPPNPP